ncbi:MAG: pyrroline-5-carboxylate reductase [Gammaproteobacteria bacterium]|nr:pyrroline-5-carboxylate reductase [Gammaproteobacteria bacterium]
MNRGICFIGAGNMARSLIGGLIANGRAPGDIVACDIDTTQLDALQERFGIRTSSDNLAAAHEAEVVVLAVKPQVMPAVCQALAALPQGPAQLFVSVAAGTPVAAIDACLGGSRAIVRCMPNTPALLQLGATGIYANPRVSAAQRRLAESLLEAVGVVIAVDEEGQLDAVTAISGSGPAYFFYFIELLASAGVKLGLPPDTAARLARQTALGASTMALDDDVVDLRARVTSRKGTTEQAILSFQGNNLERLVDEATAAAASRARELGLELGQQE